MSASSSIWTVKTALEWIIGFLGEKGDAHPRRSAEWLLSAATGLSRIELYAYYDRLLAPEECTTLRRTVKRRAEGEPLQYVTGEMPFRRIFVRVTRGVFIPRPETEVLVEEGLTFLREHGGEKPVVVDLCTGSGCVACSVAHEDQRVSVHAVDVLPLAVKVARDNAARLNLADRVIVYEGDLTAPLPPALLGRVDVLLANPPYIPTAELPDLPKEVACFEPRLALDGGPDGLEVARRIMNEATRWLRPGGLLAIELDERQVENAVKSLSAWYEEVRTVKDLAGRSRIAAGRLR